MNSGKYAFWWPVCLEHPVELALHVFPDAVAPRLDDHAAAHVAVFGEVGGLDDLLVPLGEILVAAGIDGGFGGLGLRVSLMGTEKGKVAIGSGSQLKRRSMLAQLPAYAPFPEVGFLAFSVVWLLATVFWLWMLLDCLKAGRVAGREKIVWVVVLLCTYVFGAVLYLVVVWPRQSGR